jgi:hypothetical protein
VIDLLSPAQSSSTGPHDFWVAVVGSLVGALAGGMAAWLVARSQTSKVLAQDRKLAADAAAEERRAHRDELTRAASINCLSELANLQENLRDTYSPATLRGMPLRGSADVFEDIRRTAMRDAVLLPDAARDRWSALVTLLEDMRLLRRWINTRDGERHGDELWAGWAGAALDWDDEMADRAAHDVRSYFWYVHRTLLALVNDRPIPPDVDPPVIARQDRSIWQAPDEEYYSGEPF